MISQGIGLLIGLLGIGAIKYLTIMVDVSEQECKDKEKEVNK